MDESIYKQLALDMLKTRILREFKNICTVINISLATNDIVSCKYLTLADFRENGSLNYKNLTINLEWLKFKEVEKKFLRHVLYTITDF